MKLPIDDALPRILGALDSRGALVLVAEPGAGKTTRVPAALLDHLFGEQSVRGAGELIVLEPRRLAARLAAERVAAERGGRVGEEVGYRVRFEARAGAATRLCFVTPGILVRRLLADPELEGVAALVVDEVHERGLEADLALAWAARLRDGRRPDLRLVAMSATLDAAPLASLLDAALVEVAGRAHPVRVEHDQRPDERPLEGRVAGVVEALYGARDEEGSEKGDALVFLPGAAEIERAARAIESLERAGRIETRRLHGSLPPAESRRALAPRSGAPRVILSTNVAESSVTIPGVRVVVDSGLARVARVSPWSGLPELRRAPVSQAAAAQRAGRAGREAPGLCRRLYTAADHAARPPFERPEIERADLAALVLQLAALGARPEALAWPTPPPAAALASARALLGRLGALEEGADALSERGRSLLAIPAHPRLGVLALEAAARGHVREGALLAALVEEGDPREGGHALAGARPDAASGDSDLLVRLDALEAALEAGGRARDFRGARLVPSRAERVVRAARAIERALQKGGARARGARATTSSAPERSRYASRDEALRRATLAGFPDRVGQRRRPGARDVVFAEGGSGELAAESAVREARWLVAVDAHSGGGRTRIHAASAIEAEWLLELEAAPLVEESALALEGGAGRVVERATLRYGALALIETKSPAPAGAARDALLLAEARARGVASFVDVEALERLRARVAFARAEGAALPTLDEALIDASLAELAAGSESLNEMSARGLLDLLRARLGAGVRALDELAPEQLALHGGRRARIDYAEGRPPSLASRLQDFFGRRETPRIAKGRVPLTLHLLAPNGRAVQVTSDLEGFWERHYPRVRRELMRRYPRHAWPEDPLAAEPPARGRTR